MGLKVDFSHAERNIFFGHIPWLVQGPSLAPLDYIIGSCRFICCLSQLFLAALFMATWRSCRGELFLFGFHDAAAKIIILFVCCCTFWFVCCWACCYCLGFIWLGCCLEMANFLLVACCVLQFLFFSTNSLSLACISLAYSSYNLLLLGFLETLSFWGLLYISAQSAFPSLAFQLCEIRCDHGTTLNVWDHRSL